MRLLYGPRGPYTAVAFGEDSKTIVAVAGDGVVTTYDCRICGDTDDLLALSTFTAGRDELVARVRRLRDLGYQQLAVQLVPGHESAIEDWAEVFARV